MSLSADDLLEMANFRRRRQGEDDQSSKKFDNEEKFRINSPRKRQEEQNLRNATSNKGSILVKLPDNIEEQMNRHKNDRQRMREAMLGFPAIFPTSSAENVDNKLNKHDNEDDDDDIDDDEDDDEIDVRRRPTFSTEKTSTTPRRTNSHPQQTRQNGGEARQSDAEIGEITSTTTSTTRLVTTTPRIVTSGLDETPWDVPPKNSDKTVDKNDDSLSRREPTSSRSVWSIAWEAHVYFSGTLFVLLAIYCSVNILRLHTFSRY